MISPVRKIRRSGNFSRRLVGVVDRALDAVAEAELGREAERQVLDPEGEALLAEAPHDRGVVVAGDPLLDLAAQAEALAEVAVPSGTGLRTGGGASVTTGSYRPPGARDEPAPGRRGPARRRGGARAPAGALRSAAVGFPGNAEVAAGGVRGKAVVSSPCVVVEGGCMSLVSGPT